MGAAFLIVENRVPQMRKVLQHFDGHALESVDSTHLLLVIQLQDWSASLLEKLWKS
jgi:hypothetical protein